VLEKDAAGRGVLDTTSMVKLAHILDSFSEMVASITEYGLKLTPRGPNHVWTVKVVHHRRSHLAVVRFEAFDQLREKLRPEFDIVVEKQNVIATSIHSCSDALIITGRDTEVFLIRDYGEELALCPALGDRVVAGGVVDSPYMKVLEVLSLKRGEKSWEHRRTVEKDRYYPDFARSEVSR
jgi:hypothetical protein